MDKYLLGSKDLLNVEVLISNFGEDAFESNFYMTMPAGLQYRRVEKIGDLRDTPITCTAPTRENNLLKCELGNPFPGGKVAKFKVILNPSKKVGMAPSYDFFMEANSTNSERDGSTFDNIYRKSVGIWVKTDLKIKGNAQPDELHYNISQYMAMENSTTEHDIGPQVHYFFDISNDGPSTVEEMEIFVMWPYETQDGDDLMYLLSNPQTSKNIQCDSTRLVNRNNLKIDAELEKIDYVALRSGVARTAAGHKFAMTQEGEESNVAIHSSTGQSSSSSSSSSSSGSRTVTFKSEEERKKLDAEDDQESVGDASLIHRQRSQSGGAVSSSAAQRGNASGGAFQHSWASSSADGGPTITRVQNRTSVTGADGRTRHFESSTEYSNVQSASFGGSNAGSSQRGSYRQESRNSGVSKPGAGIYKIEDVQTEEHVNQDLASGSVRGGGFSSATTERATTPSGRRRMMSQQDGEPVRPDLIRGVSPIEKIAQGGHGFQAGTLDVGTLDRNNVDDELHRRGGTSSVGSSGGGQRGGATTSFTYHQAGGQSGHQSGQQSGNQSGYQTSYQSGHQSGQQSGHQSGHSSVQYGQSGGSTGGSRTYSSGGSGTSFGSGSRFSGGGGATGTSTHTLNDNEPEDDYSLGDYEEYTDELDNTQNEPVHHSNTNHHRPQQYTASSGYQQQPGTQRSHFRFRRDANDDEEQLDRELTCNATKCAIMRCVAGPLPNAETLYIFLRTRLVAYTLDKNTLSVPLNISAKVVARVIKLPYIGEPQEKPLKTLEVPVKAIPEPILKPDVVPLWVVILSAVAGTIILLLLIYLLYKVGVQ